MRLHIIRHADPDYERDTLTDQGHLEAQALADRLAAQGIDHLYTSPLGRARATAQYAADRLGLPPVVEDWTQELRDCGVEEAPWGAIAAWDVPGECVRAIEPLPAHGTWHLTAPFQSPGLREVFYTVQCHSDALLQRHGYVRDGGRYRCVSPNRDRIAVFCHNGFGLTWLAHLLALPLVLVWCGFWLAPSSVTTILFEERSSEWAVPRCIGLGDVSHLYAAGLSARPVALQGNVD